MPQLINTLKRSPSPAVLPPVVSTGAIDSVDEALIVIGGLSTTSKMPWYSWSTSAFECITGSKLRQIPGSTCSTCYALKGRYVFPNVKAAHARRRAALSHPQFEEAFVFALNTLYARGRRTYTRNDMLVPENRFRWFDSGDIDSVATLAKIVRIAEQTPQIDHWLPTREVAILKTWLAVHKQFPANLLVRISTPMIGDRFAKQPLGLPFSTVDRSDGDISVCPAPTQDNKCNDCRACWDGGNVSYNQH